MKKLCNWLKANKLNIVIAIMAIIAVGFGVITLVSLISWTDFEPATTEDWNYLDERWATLKNQNLETLLGIDDITMTIEDKSVTIESEQCFLRFEMDDKNELVETERSDKAILGGELIFIGFLVLVWSIASGIIFFAGEVIIGCAVEWCFEKIMLLKQKWRKRES